MRAELLPPQIADDWDALIEQAFASLEAGDSPAMVAETLSVAMGFVVDAGILDSAFGSVSAGEAAWQFRVAADPQLVRKVEPTRQELVEIVQRIMPTSSSWDNEHTPWWTALLSAHVPHPAPMDLIFHPPSGVDLATWDAAAIVAHAAAHRPIEL